MDTETFATVEELYEHLLADHGIPRATLDEVNGQPNRFDLLQMGHGEEHEEGE